MSDESTKGRFVWYELMTTDTDAAKSFYHKAVGWGSMVFEGAGTPYSMWTVGQAPIGGVMNLPDDAVAQGAPPHWVPYIGAPDVDQTVARATELGATVHVEATDIPTIGRFAVLGDPQGATFAVYKSVGDEAMPDRPADVGEFSWDELAAANYETAFDFYSDLFGWAKTDSMDMGEMGMYQMYGRNGTTLGGMYNKPADMPAPPHWLLYVRVDDIDKAVETIQEAGGQILRGPMDVPDGDRVAQCMDPQGAAFAIHCKSK